MPVKDSTARAHFVLVLITLIVLLLLFAPKTSSALGKGFGKAVRGFKSGLREGEQAVGAKGSSPTSGSGDDKPADTRT